MKMKTRSSAKSEALEPQSLLQTSNFEEQIGLRPRTAGMKNSSKHAKAEETPMKSSKKSKTLQRDLPKTSTKDREISITVIKSTDVVDETLTATVPTTTSSKIPERSAVSIAWSKMLEGSQGSKMSTASSKMLSSEMYEVPTTSSKIPEKSALMALSVSKTREDELNNTQASLTSKEKDDDTVFTASTGSDENSQMPIISTHTQVAPAGARIYRCLLGCSNRYFFNTEATVKHSWIVHGLKQQFINGIHVLLPDQESLSSNDDTDRNGIILSTITKDAVADQPGKQKGWKFERSSRPCPKSKKPKLTLKGHVPDRKKIPNAVSNPEDNSANNTVSVSNRKIIESYPTEDVVTDGHEQRNKHLSRPCPKSKKPVLTLEGVEGKAPNRKERSEVQSNTENNSLNPFPESNNTVSVSSRKIIESNPTENVVTDGPEKRKIHSNHPCPKSKNPILTLEGVDGQAPNRKERSEVQSNAENNSLNPFPESNNTVSVSNTGTIKSTPTVVVVTDGPEKQKIHLSRPCPKSKKTILSLEGVEGQAPNRKAASEVPPNTVNKWLNPVHPFPESNAVNVKDRAIKKSTPIDVVVIDGPELSFPQSKKTKLSLECHIIPDRKEASEVLSNPENNSLNRSHSFPASNTVSARDRECTESTPTEDVISERPEKLNIRCSRSRPCPKSKKQKLTLKSQVPDRKKISEAVSNPENNAASESEMVKFEFMDRQDCQSIMSDMSAFLPPMSYYGENARSNPVVKPEMTMPKLCQFGN